jgi:ammonia channel protein AmtB
MSTPTQIVCKMCGKPISANFLTTGEVVRRWIWVACATVFMVFAVMSEVWVLAGFSIAFMLLAGRIRRHNGPCPDGHIN